MSDSRLSKIAVIRPGALGDVLAARGVLRFLKDVFPGAELILAAPGERGRLFLRPGWADSVLDWDKADFAWLFSDGAEPPPALVSAFAGCGLILSYAGMDEARRLRARLETLSPGGRVLLSPAFPQAGRGEPIGEWLVTAAAGFLRGHSQLPPSLRVDVAALASSRLRLDGGDGRNEPDRLVYAVLHPGSGSPKKNWPLANFIELGRIMALAMDGNGLPLFQRMLVASGEADGDLGENLASAIPGAEHRFSPPLEELARLLAGARLYFGNDSGVSHLAAAVETLNGASPMTAVVFGPSDSAVWRPPGALALEAGPGADGLSPGEVWPILAKRMNILP